MFVHNYDAEEVGPESVGKVSVSVWKTKMWAKPSCDAWAQKHTRVLIVAFQWPVRSEKPQLLRGWEMATTQRLCQSIVEGVKIKLVQHSLSCWNKFSHPDLHTFTLQHSPPRYFNTISELWLDKIMGINRSSSQNLCSDKVHSKLQVFKKVQTQNK